VSLSGRVRLQESCARSPEDVVRELYEAVFGVQAADPTESTAGGGAPGGA